MVRVQFMKEPTDYGAYRCYGGKADREFYVKCIHKFLTSDETSG